MYLDIDITANEFAQYRQLIYRIAGINMTDAKRALVQGRLAKRLKHYGLSSYKGYFDLLMSREDELQVAVDLLTTNETYFFREPKHFEYLRQEVLPQHSGGRPFRVWSAASSSGEEPYTLGMVLADHFAASPWEILASDISTRVLAKARSGLYEMERVRDIPVNYLKAFCLKGVGAREGSFLIEPRLRQNIRFTQINLVDPLPDTGEFDAIFLRNVMIYFDAETKKAVIARLLTRLRPGGWFFVGHSESLHGLTTALTAMAPSVYRKTAYAHAG
jgi:chemotaxis protein methyltransferase CheR